MLTKICFLLLLATSLALKSPVLIWSSSRALSDLPQSHTGKTVEQHDFRKSFLKPLSTKNNLVVFVQDRLSLQDLNEHADVYNAYSDGGAFKNIKALMEDQFSVQIPSVMSPWLSVEKMMKDFKGKVHQVLDAADVNNLDLGSDANLIIVSLNPVQGSKNEGEILAKNDAKIAEITKHLTKRGVQFTALYTGKSAAKVSDVPAGVSRHLQGFDDISVNGTFINVTCKDRASPLYLYMRSVTVSALDGDKFNNITIFKLEDDGTTCDNDTAKIKLKNIASTDVSLSLEWNVLRDNMTDFWNVTTNTMALSWTGSLNVSDIELDLTKMWAPQDFSYHCSDFIIMQAKNSSKIANITLAFDGLQIQPFNIMDGKFSDGWDCVVFFTPGIWMAIFSVLVMTLIILFGLNMIASLKTMDRYDDPKGKTITVNVNE